MIKNQLSLLHWHIELSSICTLKCPRCPRAEIPETLLNKQLSLLFFQEQIKEDIIRQIKRITFCGNDGDPIYCNDFVPIVKWIKEINPQISLVIITNGSYKKESWWKQVALLLNKYDEIHWSLDGWDQESNNKYRINSNWESIINGIKTFTKYNTETYMVWACIAFNFNESKLSHIESIAKDLSFDLFQLTLSTKFGSKYPDAYGINDNLEPSNKYIPEGHRFTRNTTTLTEKPRYSENIKRYYQEKFNNLTQPRLCFIGNKGLFLNSYGEFYPCCWVATRYDHNESWAERGKTKFNLHNKTFNEILNDPFWTDEFLKFDNLECKTKCATSNFKNNDYYLNW